MIRLENICKEFDGRPVLQNFSLHAAPGERVCLTGESGCGKSTLLSIAAGGLLPDSGEVFIRNGAKKAFLFQNDRLLPWLNALENITVTGASEKSAMEMLEKMGIAEDFNKLPAQLSGGMSRRLAIARVLAYGGDIYYLDEPLQGLDEATAEKVIEVLRQELEGKTVLMVSHINSEISALATRTIELKRIY